MKRQRSVPLSLALLALAMILSACASAQRPRSRDPGLVSLSAAAGNRFVPSGERSEIVARVRVDVQAATDRRTSVNLALVIDTSGSMEGQPMEDARAAALALVDALRDGDRLAVVSFDSRARVVSQSAPLDAETRARFRDRIRAMRARGTTDLAGGLRMGIEQLAPAWSNGGINRVVLLSDGVPNDPEGIEQMARAAGARGITITALGLGADYDETLMGHVAQLSGGRFHYVEDSSRVAEVFRDEVLRLQRVVAREAVATLTPGPGVEILGVVGLASSRRDDALQVSLGDLTEGEQRDLVLRLNVPSRREGASVELLDAALTFRDALDNAGRLERDAFIGVRATRDTAQREGGRDRDVEASAASATLAAGTLEVIQAARSGEIAQAQARMEQLLDQARNASTYRSRHLERQAASVASLGEALRAMPSRAPAAPGVQAAPPPPMPSAVREAHDEAMSVLQGD